MFENIFDLTRIVYEERERVFSSIEISLKNATLFLTDIHELFKNAKLKTVPPKQKTCSVWCHSAANSVLIRTVF